MTHIRSSSLVAVTIVITALAGCTAIQNFLIPPSSSSSSVRSVGEGGAVPPAGLGHSTGPAEAVVWTGSVWGQPDARALALRGGRIAYVGPQAGAEPLVGPATEMERHPDTTTLPPLRDSHVRLAEQIQLLDGLDAVRIRDLAALERRVRMACDSLGEDDWLWVHNLPAALLAPAATQHETTTPRCAVLYTAEGGDKGRLSSAARSLVKERLAGVKDDGRLDGLALLRQVRAALPVQRVSRQKPLLVQVLGMARQLGWSEIEAVDGSPALVEALQTLAAEGRLPLPVRVWLGRQQAQGLTSRPREQARPGVWVEVVGVSLEWPAVPLAEEVTVDVAGAVRAVHNAGWPALLLPATSVDTKLLLTALSDAALPDGAVVRLDAPFDLAEAALPAASAPQWSCVVLPTERAATALKLEQLGRRCAGLRAGSGLGAGVASPADVAAAAEGDAVALLANPGAALIPGQPGDFVLWRGAGPTMRPVLAAVRGQLLPLQLR